MTESPSGRFVSTGAPHRPDRDRDQPLPGHPLPTVHTQVAYDPVESDFTAHWTRADARQLAAMSDPTMGPWQNSMPAEYTMPTIPEDFPDMSGGAVWVWDSWPLCDARARQYAVNGWEVLFSLVADRSLIFDDRHVHARIGYFFRPCEPPAHGRERDGGWTYGGRVFADGVAAEIFEDKSFSHQTEWSGSARVFPGGEVKLFFTPVAFYRGEHGDRRPYDARIGMSVGRIHADQDGVVLSGFEEVHDLLRPDGRWYQTGEQNEHYNFRDPFTFEDPAHPGKTFMVFEGNSAVTRGGWDLTEADLGYREDDPAAERLHQVHEMGAQFQMANIGLAVAENGDLTRWRFLPPILSANGVTDQTERPQIYLQDGKYYLFTISHRGTYAPGIDGPEGVYGFVGEGIRCDYQPMNRGSGLVLGNPTNLNYPMGYPYEPAWDQHSGTFQAYSHYVMPDGLVQSFIDGIGTPHGHRRGGTLGPTVRIVIDGEDSYVDHTYGNAGLGEYADVPADAEI